MGGICILSPKGPSYGKGHWFHSRSSSSEGELLNIGRLVSSSKKPDYAGLRWSGDKTNPKNIKFASEIGVNASTMQTKIRAFIRFGFLKDKISCPLEWTILGELLNSLSTDPRQNVKDKAPLILQLILTFAFSIYAFDSKGFVDDPSEGYRPLLGLLKSVDGSGFISEKNFVLLVGHQNLTYWITDLVDRSKILVKISGGYKIGNSFPKLLKAVVSLDPLPSLSKTEWMEVRSDLFIKLNPFREHILSDMNEIFDPIVNLESTIPQGAQSNVIKILEQSSELEEEEIQRGDYSVPDEYGPTKKRKKQRSWSNLVKKDYGEKCCIPNCDIEGKEFLEGAHIKAYSAPEEGNGHRADPKNGLCLCPLCHLMFDKGYFTLNDGLEIIVSSAINGIISSRLKDPIQKSVGKRINPPSDYPPRLEYVKFHREKNYLGD